jgi:hypothetical protein
MQSKLSAVSGTQNQYAVMCRLLLSCLFNVKNYNYLSGITTAPLLSLITVYRFEVL